jgi:hypothetical protein
MREEVINMLMEVKLGDKTPRPLIQTVCHISELQMTQLKVNSWSF